MITQRIQLGISNDIFDKVMFFWQSLPINLVNSSNEKKIIEPKKSLLENFHALIHKTQVTMNIATDTSEITNEGAITWILY